MLSLTMVRQVDNLFSRAPTLRSKSPTILSAECRAAGVMAALSTGVVVVSGSFKTGGGCCWGLPVGVVGNLFESNVGDLVGSDFS